MFAPKQIGNTKLQPDELRRDKKACVKIGPCGIGEKAVYLNSFFVDRTFYAAFTDIRRVFKRVAMSKGGFTGKGVFGSIPYLVVLLSDGTEKQCNFKYEEQVDEFLARIRRTHPEIPTISEQAQKRLEEARRAEEARYVKELTPDAQKALDELNAAKTWLEKRPEVPDALSFAARQKRTIDRMNPYYRYAAVAVFLLALGALVVGIVSLIRHDGFAAYFILFGMAFLFYTMSSQILPTGRNNKNYAQKRWQEALSRSSGLIAEYRGGAKDGDGQSAFPLPAQYVHPAVLARMIRVIREGRAQSVQEAYEVMKADLKAMNSDVTVSQAEYDEIMAVKPMFLLCGYSDDPA